jgi:UV DNA damage endonuclease
MSKINIGYCCLSLGINEGKKKADQVLVNRGMVKRTFESRGLSYVSDLIKLNLDDTFKVLQWNVKNGIFVYRMSSDSLPWMTNYKFTELPDFNIIKGKLNKIGKFIKENNIRSSYHPGPYCVLASNTESVVEKTIDELKKHAELMDYMGLDQTPYYPINIHVNITKPSKEDSMERFCKGFDKLSDSCKKRLTIENDDSINQYSVLDLYNGLYSRINIPIVFDQHHFKYGPQDQNMEDAMKLAFSTWGSIKPLIHMSSSKKIEDVSSVATAHADLIYEKIQDFDLEFDVEIEAKLKDIAVFDYIKKFTCKESLNK